ncbi:hypothetical protein HDU76_002350 [Blyttiomyces sp. JEL0837]|nr:hypothetical protein HDU76_002350 [Blyttiomyces sp. JEL0837]
MRSKPATSTDQSTLSSQLAQDSLSVLDQTTTSARMSSHRSRPSSVRQDRSQSDAPFPTAGFHRHRSNISATSASISSSNPRHGFRNPDPSQIQQLVTSSIPQPPPDITNIQSLTETIERERLRLRNERIQRTTAYETSMASHREKITAAATRIQRELAILRDLRRDMSHRRSESASLLEGVQVSKMLSNINVDNTASSSSSAGSTSPLRTSVQSEHIPPRPIPTPTPSYTSTSGVSEQTVSTETTSTTTPTLIQPSPLRPPHPHHQSFLTPATSDDRYRYDPRTARARSVSHDSGMTIRVEQDSTTMMMSPEDSDEYYYGADFSNPDKKVLHVDSGLEGLVVHQKPASYLDKDRDAKKLDNSTSIMSSSTVAKERGNVFISALTNVAESRRQSSAVDLESPTSSSSIPSGSSISTSSSSHIHFSVPLNSTSTAPATRGESSALAFVGKHVVPVGAQPAAVDCSHLFPDEVGQRAGLYVFLIDNMEPELIDDVSRIGKFCLADCYLILHSIAADQDTPTLTATQPSPPSTPSTNSDPDRLQHSVWTWIGPQAEMDKRFCCAMFAVGLKNWIGTSSSVIRQSYNEESDEFLNLFNGSIEYESDLSKAGESGLYVPEEFKYPLRVYRLFGKPNVRLRLCCPKWWVLDSEGVFVVDNGLEILQWNGVGSSLANRSKGRIICDSINANERVGRATIFEMDEGQEDDRLWEIIGKRKGTPKSETSSLSSSDDSEDEGEEDPDETAYFNQLSMDPVKIYAVPESASVVADFDSRNDFLVSSTSDLLRKAFLQKDGCFILDAGVEIFLWVGARSDASRRDAAAHLLARLVRGCKRPSWLALHRILDGQESEVFKLRFMDWAEPRRISRAHDKSKIKPLYVDVRALYAPNPYKFNLRRYHVKSSPYLSNDPSTSSRIQQGGTSSSRNNLAKHGTGSTSDLTSPVAKWVQRLEWTMKEANRRMMGMTSFVFDRGGRFVQLESWEHGHLCCGEAYVFLCVYSKSGKSKKVANEEDEQDDAMTDVENSTGWIAGSDEDVGDSLQSLSEIITGSLLTKGMTNVEDGGGHSSGGEGGILSPERVTENWGTPLGASNMKRGASTMTMKIRSSQPQNNSEFECVAYFWEGRRASRLAKSTFQFKARSEVMELVKEAYGCPLRIVIAEPGREPLALLAHFGNRVVVHGGKRVDLLNKRKTWIEKSGVPMGDSTRSANSGKSRQRDDSASEASVFHIRTDFRYQTVRAFEMDGRPQAFVSRDCYYIHPSLNDWNADLRPLGFLWVGRSATRGEVRKAHTLSEMVVRLFEPYVGALSLGSLNTLSSEGSNSRGASADNLNERTDSEGSLNGSPYGSNLKNRPYRIVSENLEPRSFWKMLGITTVGPMSNSTSGMITSPLATTSRIHSLHPTTPIPILTTSSPTHDQDPPPPRLLICSCSRGYFSVEEVPFFIQADLKSDACAILDQGPPSAVYVWCGKAASDVVRKLTRKAVQVWLETLDDGRWEAWKAQRKRGTPGGVAGGTQRKVGGSIIGSPSSGLFGGTLSMSSKHATQGQDESIVWVEEGSESVEFKYMFHGWESGQGDVVEPGNRFTREEMMKKREKFGGGASGR